jgi:uncharacterized peroxidase-related enzyme
MTTPNTAPGATQDPAPDTLYDPSQDTIDLVTALQPDDARYQMRHAREKIARHTQLSEQALFDPSIDDISIGERLFAAWYAASLSGVPSVSGVYRRRLDAMPGSEPAQAALATFDALAPEESVPSAAAVRADAIAEVARVAGKRLAAIAAHTLLLADAPVLAEPHHVQALQHAGFSTRAIVVLSQLIAFVSYQTRVVAMIHAMGDKANGGYRPTPAPAALIESRTYTFDVLGWKAWADTVTLENATADQTQVLEESHPKAKTSDYYLLLVHAPEILRQRSLVFNAIMYGNGGLSRAERELGATVVSRINGCVYCASVHAQRFGQLAKRVDSIEQVYANPASAGISPREQAIVQFAIALTRAPSTLDRQAIAALNDAGLNAEEILDLTHSIAIFAWANRLMLTLGEPTHANGPAVI